ncbi:MAG TPA: exonuclease SbcCD subunit D [Pyrinomonadaceae bacterium]|nr:exonuclease SbcCD subunit D [Pyrinomonadaceae bacterium]
MIKFLHLSDVHLGCRRYNLEERTKDFFRSWYDVITNHAIPNEVDFVLIAGDLFDRRNIDPQTMNHAMIGLQLLKEAAIPVIAIEGNHDRRDAVSPYSWMRSFSQAGYMILLEPARSEESPIEMVPWNEEERAGSYVDIKGARVFGSHWYGTTANVAMSILSDAVRRARDEAQFNILLLHTDVEGQLSRPIPALSVEKLKELRAHVNYVALGHTHKRFEIEGWAFNPGSLEACTIDEYREERGLYLVEVDDERRINARHIRDYTQRPFQRLSFDVSGVTEPEEVHAGVLELVRREARAHDPESGSPAPIIEISLRGHLGFKNSLLDLRKLREESQELTGALHVMMRNQSVPVEYAVAAGLDADTTRAQREQRIVEDLIARDTRYRDRAREMAELVLDAKRRALGDEDPAEILSAIEQKLEGSPRDRGEAAATAPAPSPGALQALERSAEKALTSDR